MSMIYFWENANAYSLMRNTSTKFSVADFESENDTTGIIVLSLEMETNGFQFRNGN